MLFLVKMVGVLEGETWECKVNEVTILKDFQAILNAA